MDEYYDTKEADEKNQSKTRFPSRMSCGGLKRGHPKSRSKERFAVQEAAIVGFNDNTFMRGMTRVKDVVSRIAYNLPATGELDTDSWLAPDEGKGMGPKVSTSCRYFTCSRQIPPESKAAFDKYVDPHSVLQRMETEGMAHCYENKVVYLQLDNGRLETKDPAGFMEGDVVELGFFVQGFKKNGNDGVVRLVMRMLTLLDRDTSQKAGIAHRQARKPIEHPIRTFNEMLTASNHVDRKKRMLHLSDSEDNKMPLTRRCQEPFPADR
ncbi:hypothetical protein C8R43DRAFT_965619 [Mycena crocata]|nr:hypothetical protein C8R43DRAFT_965619 [Mycena crocata]